MEHYTTHPLPPHGTFESESLYVRHIPGAYQASNKGYKKYDDKTSERVAAAARELEAAHTRKTPLGCMSRTT